jgi:hypothetical protein
VSKASSFFSPGQQFFTWPAFALPGQPFLHGQSFLHGQPVFYLANLLSSATLSPL